MPGGCDDSPAIDARDVCNKRVAHRARCFCSPNEYSVTVASERLYYKFFAEPKPACSIIRLTFEKRGKENNDGAP